MSWKDNKMGKSKVPAKPRQRISSKPQLPMLVGSHPENSIYKSPLVNWNCPDIQMCKVWDEATVQDFLGAPDDAVVYRSIVNINDIDEHLDIDDYDWQELSMGGSPPPVVIRRMPDGKLRLEDGNHRVHFWRQRGYDGVPAWVLDDLLTNYHRSHGIKKWRIVND